MRVGVCGHSGFVGGNLINGLKGSYEIIPISLRNIKWTEDLIDVNVIINLVGKAHDHHGTTTKDDYYHINLELTKNIFHAFINSSASLFIHVSSLAALEEYESVHPLTEMDTCKPISWYGMSKRAAEEWLMKQSLPTNKRIVIIRPPMIHGVGDKGNLGLLYKLISKGLPYPLSSFDNVRSFISIENFIFFIKKLVDNQHVIDSGVYHVADDQAVSTKEIITIIKNVTGKNVLDIALPKFLVHLVAMIGDFVPIPLNSKRLKKMTGNLELSNAKIKNMLSIGELPLLAKEGLELTIRSFNQNK